MANQIARQQNDDPTVDAVAATEEHLAASWEHRMRVDLPRAIERDEVTVDDGVVQAVVSLAVTA